MRSPDTGRVSVVPAGTSESLTVSFDPLQLPWLGLWINNEGWSGCGGAPYRNLGLEPATAAFDCVSKAAEDGAIPWLDPGETRRWTLDVESRA